ncbi:MAG TPA: GNAT family N-acetyltransferase [Acidimicrobiales bacterium]|nr:GNAT family N-acetyltransferase [Acidimicrobiales bacterium]
MNRRNVELRPVRCDDDELLCRLYRSTRDAELCLLDWDEAQKDAFVRMQFEAQNRHYREHYPDASSDIVLVDGAPAGYLSVARWPRDIRVVDIALFPEHRNAGVGTTLLRRLLVEGAARAVQVSMHVERSSPARRLYERLGFASVSESAIYVLMAWQPADRPSGE